MKYSCVGYMETNADAIGDQTFSFSLADGDSNENTTAHEGNTQQNATETSKISFI
jgi:hypothetical protein